MSCSRQPKAGARGARDVVASDETVTGTTDSEMFIPDAVNGERDLDASTTTAPSGGVDSEKALGVVVPFIGDRNLDNVTSILTWRGGRALHSQGATGTLATSSRQRRTPEERWLASLEAEIARIRQRYQEQERILEWEIIKHEQRYEAAMKLLEEEYKDEGDCPIAEWWEVQSDYQPTECGDDGSRYLVPERELKQQALGQHLQITEQH